MFNSGLKKEAMADLESANRKYKEKFDDTVKKVVGLHDYRVKLVETIKSVENFINSIANKPKEFEKDIQEIKLNRTSFETNINELELESKKAAKVSGSVAGAGMAAGAGVAAFGPTAAMAIATTFGTASTGTAIASLSGAAATNAALAWLGGGAIAASGGGMAAGNALLALAGPVGWAIGGAALVGGGLLASSKNKKVAEQAETQTRSINKERANLEKIDAEVKEISNLTIKHESFLKDALKMLSNIPKDYTALNDDLKYQLGSLVNNTRSLSELLNRKVS